jgi:hypothetical protein
MSGGSDDPNVYIAMLFLILEESRSNNRFNWFRNNRLCHIKNPKV